MNDNNDINQFLLPPKISNKKTLVLDLDETLVHSQFLEFSIPSDIIIKIGIEKEIYDIHVLIRPGVKEFLEEMKDYYEIVIFTASISKYADILINIIDQKGYCPYRLFREHCTFINNTFIKDLTKLGRDLKDIIIVDNSPFSYSFHPNNGLPILSWFEDKDDKELFNIIPILIFLSKVNDVREYIPKMVINNTISYIKAEQLISKYNNKKVNNVNNINTSKNNENICNKNDNKKNAKGYNINIQIVQNNINNINNIINEKVSKDDKNKLKYLNFDNNELKNIKKQTQTIEKITTINPKSIISNIDNPNNNKKVKKGKNIFHKRQNTFSININKVNLNQINNDKNYKNIINNQECKNKNKNININKLINKSQKENTKKNEKTIHYKQIHNIINKKRKRIETPTNINAIFFSNNNNKINNIFYNKIIKTPTSISKNKKRNKSNNDRTKLLLPKESSEFNLVKKLYTLSYKNKDKDKDNANNNNQKRNINKYNFIKNKTKFKPSNYRRIFFDRDDNINNVTNITKYSSNMNTINKKMRNEEIFCLPSHRKQSSYNENNFFLRIKKNLIKSNELKSKNTSNKSNFLKNEVQKFNNLNKINTNINYFKNKLIKKTYGHYKKINIKKIECINRKDKKKIQIDLKNKNTEKNTKMNLNSINLNGNIFNLYKTLNPNEKKYVNNEFNNTLDTFLNDTKSSRKINHQKTISYNFNSTRTLNNCMITKNKNQNEFKKNNKYIIKSIKKTSKNEINNIYCDIKKNKKSDSFVYLKNMFKNKFFDYLYYTKDNINKNELTYKKDEIKNVNKKSKIKNN